GGHVPLDILFSLGVNPYECLGRHPLLVRMSNASNAPGPPPVCEAMASPASRCVLAAARITRAWRDDNDPSSSPLLMKPGLMPVSSMPRSHSLIHLSARDSAEAVRAWAGKNLFCRAP